MYDSIDSALYSPYYVVKKDGLAFANSNFNDSCSLGETTANSVALSGFPINCPLQVKPYLWELGGNCIMKSALAGFLKTIINLVD